MTKEKKVNQKQKQTRAAEVALVFAAVESVFTSLRTHFPFINWPVINTVVKFSLQKLFEYLSNNAIMYFNVMWIQITINKEIADLERERQKAILGVKQNVTDKELDELDRKMLEAFERLNRFGRGPL